VLNMGNLEQLKGAMWTTVLITLVIFTGFIVVVSFFVSYAVGLDISPIATFLGALGLELVFMLIQFTMSVHRCEHYTFAVSESRRKPLVRANCQ
jgi:hypothetical protein